MPATTMSHFVEEATTATLSRGLVGIAVLGGGGDDGHGSIVNIDAIPHIVLPSRSISESTNSSTNSTTKEGGVSALGSFIHPSGQRKIWLTTSEEVCVFGCGDGGAFRMLVVVAMVLFICAIIVVAVDHHHHLHE